MTENATIQMYGADWCGDCRRAKTWFEDNGVAYDYIDLIEKPDEVETVLERNNGRKSIPVIVFPDGSHLTEPSNGDLELKMSQLASSTPEQISASSEAPRVVDNTDAHRFELRDSSGEVLSFADYQTRGAALVVPHVETALAHRGQGNADRLMAGIVEDLRSTGRTITPLCPFAAQFLRDRPETHDLLA